MTDHGSVLRFGYARGVAPMMWALIGISLVEMIVTHLLIAHWWPRVAVLLSLVTDGGMIWLIVQVRGFDAHPVTIDAGIVRFRTGRIAQADVPIAAIAGFADSWSSAGLKAERVANFALLAYPNIVVRFATPQGRRGRMMGVAHRLDDPAAFRTELSRLLDARATGG